MLFREILINVIVQFSTMTHQKLMGSNWLWWYFINIRRLSVFIYFDTLVKALSFLLDLEHEDVTCSWNVSSFSLSNLIPSTSELLDSIWAFYICICIFHNIFDVFDNILLLVAVTGYFYRARPFLEYRQHEHILDHQEKFVRVSFIVELDPRTFSCIDNILRWLLY